MGIPPTILWGRSRQTAVVDGVTVHDPDWLGVDYALVALLDEWESGLCICGEPITSHEGKTSADYAAPFLTCPALVALDEEQAAQAKRDGHKDAKPDPSRARGWIVKTLDIIRAMAGQPEE